MPPDKDLMQILTENIQNKLIEQLCEPEDNVLQLQVLRQLEFRP